jgi:hypothetical protein
MADGRLVDERGSMSGRIMMKAVLVAVAVVVEAAAMSSQAPDAARVLADMRQALGGDAALNGVKTFSVDGSESRNIGGSRRIESNIEMLCALPDRFIYARTQTGIPFEITITDGFAGDDPIRIIDSHGRPGPKDISSPAPSPQAEAARRKAEADRNKQEFARLALALFGASFDAYPLDLTWGGPDQLDGRAMEAIEVRASRPSPELGPVPFGARLLIDAQTHLPAAVVWKTPPDAMMARSFTVTTRNGRAVSSTPPVPDSTRPLPPGAVGVVGDPAVNPAAGLALVERRLVFSEFKPSDGILWPRRITESVDGEVVRQIRLGGFRINPKLDPKRFAPSRQP